MKIKTVTPVKLVKPIHTVIQIEVKTFFKDAGYTCSSGRLIVNFDSNTIIVNEVRCQSAFNTILDLKRKSYDSFKGFEKYRGVSFEGLLEVGVYLQIDIEPDKYRNVVHFGRS